MNDPIQSNASRSAEDSADWQSQRAGWAIVLVFACIALGFTAAAANYERVVATNERNHAELLATECSIAEGQLEDVGKFLADPRTKLISLTSGGDLPSNQAVIAWNPIEAHGYFFCDDLPVLDGGSGYEVWALHGTDEPVKIATLAARAGASVYPISASQGISGKIRLEITAGPRSAEKRPVFAGEIE